MSSRRLTWPSAKRALATAVLILGLLALFASPSVSLADDAAHEAAIPQSVVLTVAAAPRVCDASVYITGDLVGDGNPAEVYAALCS